jgi:hypothetical protein
MRPIVPLFLVASLVAGPTLVAASGAASQPVAQAPAGSGAGPSAAAPDAAAKPGGGQSFEERVADFVVKFYLSGEALSEDELGQLYAPSVTYFGGGTWTRARVVADKLAYYARWHTRRYTLERQTLKVMRKPGSGKVYDVSFEYLFDVTSRDRTSRGRGNATLTLDLDLDGGRITRETGNVLARW